MRFPRGFRGESRSGSQTLANEVAASVRGQYAFRRRLIPNEEEVAGGMFSVRGYPESITAGDNAVIASLEYRFHLPRTFQVSEPGHIGQRPIGMFGKDFRWAPQQSFGRADWDLIFNGFIDAKGQFQTPKFVVFALLRPWIWPSLMQMGENSKKASQSIAKRLNELLSDDGS